MLDEKIISKLRERYSDLHPLLFHRSMERCRSEADLFDILDTIPNKLPLIWEEFERRWVNTADLFQAEKFFSNE